MALLVALTKMFEISYRGSILNNPVKHVKLDYTLSLFCISAGSEVFSLSNK